MLNGYTRAGLCTECTCIHVYILYVHCVGFILAVTDMYIFKKKKKL